MPQSSLRDIEKTMTTLWMRRHEREAFLDGDDSGVNADIAGQIDKTGVELYASLLNYGHQDVIGSIFPFCAKLLHKHWEEIVDDYLEKYPPNHFNLNRSAQRFSEYLDKHQPRLKKRFPYIVELADYEWLELELLEKDVISPPSELETLESPEQFTAFAPIVNPALALRRYNYSIMKIAEEIQNSCQKPRNSSRMPTNVVVYRDPCGNRSRFLEVGSVAASIIEMALADNAAYSELISFAVSMNPNHDPQSTVIEFLAMVENLQENHLFLGNRKLR
jgi:hypothetical protein